MEEINDVLPSHGVKSFADVKLEEKRGGLAFVEPTSKAPNIHEVVVNASLFDEGTLRAGDEGMHVRAKSGSEDLSNNFCNGMNEAYRSVIRDLLRALFFG